MNKLDKKQIPQFAALCVLSAGVFGYFVVKIVTPSPAAAGTRPHPAAGASQAAPSASPASAKAAATDKAVSGTAPAGDESEAPAPTPGMRDPFVVGYVDPGTQPAAAAVATATVPATPGRVAASLTKPAKAAGRQTASIQEVGPAVVPAAPALPFGLKRLPTLGAAPALSAAPKQEKYTKAAAPEAPAAPTWTVTGVLQNEAGQVAVLRSGEARRIVRTGDAVDSVYRVVAVTRSAVVLRHGKTFYRLTLGGAKTGAPVPAKTVFLPVPALGPARTPIHGPSHEPQDDALAPVGHSASSEAELAQAIQAALLLANSYMTPAQAEVEVCLAAFHARRALPPRVAMRFLDGSVPVPGSVEARARLERGRDLYRSGQCDEGRAEWRFVLTMDDADAADEAGKLLDRYN